MYKTDRPNLIRQNCFEINFGERIDELGMQPDRGSMIQQRIHRVDWMGNG